MEFFNDEDIRVERFWCETTGTKLVMQHIPTGISVERVIGSDEESSHRRELKSQLLHRFSVEYPPQDFVIEHLWLGSEKGGSVQIRHMPSGTVVGRRIGFSPLREFRREMVAELFQRLRERKP